jgi:hypothetical protein
MIFICLFFFFAIHSGPSQHTRAPGSVREEGQHHQPDVFGERALDAAQFGGVVARHQSGGLRLASRSRRNQSGNGENRVGHHQPVTGHQGRTVRYRQLHVPAEQR